MAHAAPLTPGDERNVVVRVGAAGPIERDRGALRRGALDGLIGAGPGRGRLIREGAAKADGDAQLVVVLHGCAEQRPRQCTRLVVPVDDEPDSLRVGANKRLLESLVDDADSGIGPDAAGRRERLLWRNLAGARGIERYRLGGRSDYPHAGELRAATEIPESKWRLQREAIRQADRARRARARRAQQLDGPTH